MQVPAGRRWSMSTDGTLLASWSEVVEQAEPNLRAYDCRLQELFVCSGIMDHVDDTPFGEELHALQYGRPPASAPPREIRLYDEKVALFRDSESLAALDLDPDNQRHAKSPIALHSLEFNSRKGILALTNGHLYHMATGESSWQSVSKQAFAKRHSAYLVRTAMWSPDSLSILVLSKATLCVWSCVRGRLVLSSACLQPSIARREPVDLRRMLFRFSPDARALAVLTTRGLAVMSMGTGKVLFNIKYPRDETPCQLAWSALGDKLMLSRGGVWRVLCFGKARGLLQQAGRMVEVLQDVSKDAGCEPECVGKVGKIQVGCLSLVNDWHNQPPASDEDE